MGSSISFVQDNQSLSQKNILRGLHFQKPPHAQAKFVRVIKGSVLDVVVDGVEVVVSTSHFATEGAAGPDKEKQDL